MIDIKPKDYRIYKVLIYGREIQDSHSNYFAKGILMVTA
jgi:hypothetical protein